MRAIVQNIWSMWNVCGLKAEGCVNAVKQELSELEQGWAEFFREHPEAMIEYFQI